MKYSITINGTGADPDDVQDVFENVVRALRTIGSDKIEGSFSAANNDGSSPVTLDAAAVEDSDEPDTSTEFAPDA